MKIWVIGRGYPTTSNGMWGSFELEQAKLLARNGHEVSYLALTLSFLNRKDPRSFRVFDENGVRIYAYSHFYFPGKLGIYWEKFEDKCWRKIFKNAEADSGIPDIIHIHYPSMISSINEIDKYKKRGVGIFVTEHWSRVLINTLKKHELARLQYYAENADCFAAVSEILQNAVKKLVKVSVPTTVIPNIVSPIFFSTAEREKKDKNSFTFITVGRLVGLKQFDVVIEQFIKTFKDNENVYLRIVGAGTDRSKLEKLAADNKQISFTGELPLEETAKEIANADALVSFSKYETFAAPVAEAWACGKPVIVSDKSGISTYVNNSNGLVINANCSAALSDAMNHIYKEYNKYDSTQISLYAKDRFSDQVIIGRLEKLYLVTR